MRRRGRSGGSIAIRLAPAWPDLPPPTSFTLNALSGTFTLPENAPEGTVAGALSGRTPDSTLTLADDAGGRVARLGVNITRGPTGLDYEAATSLPFTVRETHPLATNSPRDTVLTLTVTNIDEIPPTITSANSFSGPENAPLAITLTANESVTWTKTGGADQALFTLAGNILTLPAQDYDAPADAGTNNTYDVQVTAADAAGNTASQNISVTVTDVVEGAPDNAVPGPLWNGTAGSGYAGSPPVKTGTDIITRPELGEMHGTVAPSAHFFMPEAQDEYFTDDFEIMVRASARGGIGSFVYHVEGNDYTVTEAVSRPIPVYGGTTRPAEVYPLILDYSAWPSNGAADIYATITPTDPAIAVRVLGPIRMFRKPALDREIEIAPTLSVIAGSRYQSPQAALTYLSTAGVSGEHVRLFFSEDAVIDLSVLNFSNYSAATAGRRGQTIIDGNGHAVTFERTTVPLAYMQPLFNGLIFKGVAIDIANIAEIRPQSVTAGFRMLTLIDCDIYSSNGMDELPGDEGQGISKSRRAVGAFKPGLSLRRCHIHDCDPKEMAMGVAVGSLIENLTGDANHMTQCNLFALNRIPTMNNGTLSTPRDAIQLAYSPTGAETAAFSISGLYPSPRQLDLRLDTGSGFTTVQTFVAGNYGSPLHSCAEAVAAINTYGGGWSATLIDDYIAFGAIGIAGTPNTYTEVFDQPLSTKITTALDIHSDMSQTSSGWFHENHMIYGNLCVNPVAQFALLSDFSDGCYNIEYTNNAFHMTEGIYSGAVSQMSASHHHVRFLHNTVIGQGLTMRFDIAPGHTMDAFCEVAANVYAGYSRTAGTGTFNLHFEDNHSLGGAITVTGPNVSGNTVGGSASSNFTNVNSPAFAEANFVPTLGGSIRTTPVATRVTFDINGAPRGATSWPGAVAS